MAFYKLKDITEFTVFDVSAPYWLLWDGTKYNRSKTALEGAQKKWDVVTPERNRIPITKDQFAQMLIACVKGGNADIHDRTFTIKNNGKEKKEIRYFINLKS